MAAIAPTMNIRVGVNPGEDDGSLVLASWANLNGANNTGNPVSFPHHADKCIQLTGCFNTANVVVEGSNDGATYANLTDRVGNTVLFTAPGIKTISDSPLFVRPKVATNGAVTDVGAALLMRRVPQLTR